MLLMAPHELRHSLVSSGRSKLSRMFNDAQTSTDITLYR